MAARGEGPAVESGARVGREGFPAATPQIYRRNLFAVTGLPVDASGRAVRRYQDRRTALGDTADAAEVTAALAGLREPVRRITCELFWPWGRDQEPQPAGLDPMDLAVHDRAVLAHRDALELESAGPGSVARQRRDEAWERALRGWATVLGRDGVWDRMSRRVVELADPRLDASTAADLRAALPAMLLDVNAALAVGAAVADPAGLDRHRRLMASFVGYAKLDRAMVTEALERALAGPLRRIGRGCDAVRDEVNDAPERGVEIARRVRSELVPLLDTARTVLGPDDATVRRLSDDLADALRRCAMLHHNSPAGVGDRAQRQVLDVLRVALGLATAASTRARISEPLDAIAKAPPRVSTQPATPAHNGRVAAGWAVAAVVFLLVALATRAVGYGVVSGIAALIAVVYVAAALTARPVLQAAFSAALGAAAVVVGAVLGLPWVAGLGGVVLLGGLVGVAVALEEHLLAKGWFMVATGVGLAGLASLGWGGLWQDPPGGNLFWLGPVGLWLFLPAHGFVVQGAAALGEWDVREHLAIPAGSVLAAVSLGLAWAVGGAGWPPLVTGGVLLVSGVLAGFEQVRRTQLAQVLGWTGGLLAVVALVVLGIGSIGLGWTIAIGIGVVVLLVWLGGQ